MSGRRMSVNIKKIGAQTAVNRLVRENYRNAENARQYDDGHRAIDTGRTADNVYLIDPPDDYDQIRRDRISDINDRRSKQVDYSLKLANNVKQLRESGELQKSKSREVAKTRKLRSDTVDTLGIVVQMPPEMADVWTREQQTQFFRDCLDYMQEHPDEYGRIDTAVIHYDENSPHMQCLASTLNQDTLTSDAKKIVGNKTKMSDRQTHLAEAMQAKGWGVERGVKRVNNPEYQNFKSDMNRMGIEVNRHNDAVLMDVWRDLKNREKSVRQGRDEIRRDRDDLRRRSEALEPLEKSIDRKAQALNSWEQDLNARQTAQDARQTAQDAREVELDAKQAKSLKTANTASQAVAELGELIERANRTADRADQSVKDLKSEIVTVGQAHRRARDAERAGQELKDSVAGLTEFWESQNNGRIR